MRRAYFLSEEEPSAVRIWKGTHLLSHVMDSYTRKSSMKGEWIRVETYGYPHSNLGPLLLEFKAEISNHKKRRVSKGEITTKGSS